ncbi:MAG: methyltransferase domain-containing protein [Candidatus Methanogranum gryphiswaldense]|nr:MAG: methyltransferase domain-containing protein [Candidatus Methanogranum sp. U3.2.1]
MYLTYYFDLLGECKNMPAAEAMRCIEAECEEYHIIKSGPGYLIASFDSECLDSIADRISLTHSIGRYLGACTPGDTSEIEKIELPEGSFAVRGKRFEGLMKDVDSQKLTRDVGKVLSKHNDVNLKEPDIIVRMNMSDSINLFIEEKTIDKNLLEKRKVGERPFFSPISLHPKYARALVNLTGVKRGGVVLDPFCGTGGILIEAAEMGMKTIASDFDEEMIIGCQENMNFYGLKLDDFAVADIGDIPELFDGINAVATDPPYGRSTKTGGENIDQIYSRALKTIPRVLEPDSRAGVVLPHQISCDTMTLETTFEQFVHGSLSRYYHIFHTHQ